MTRYHAVMLDETRCEFGADVEADTREQAWEMLRDNYPESSCIQLESPEDSLLRVSAINTHAANGGDWDDDGNPIYGPDYDWGDEDDDCEDLCEYEPGEALDDDHHEQENA